MAFQFRRNDGTLLAVGTDYSDTADDVNPRSIGQFWSLVRIVLPEKLEAGETGCVERGTLAGYVAQAVCRH